MLFYLSSSLQIERAVLMSSLLQTFGGYSNRVHSTDCSYCGRPADLLSPTSSFSTPLLHQLPLMQCWWCRRRWASDCYRFGLLCSIDCWWRRVAIGTALSMALLPNYCLYPWLSLFNKEARVSVDVGANRRKSCDIDNRLHVFFFSRLYDRNKKRARQDEWTWAICLTAIQEKEGRKEQ